MIKKIFFFISLNFFYTCEPIYNDPGKTYLIKDYSNYGDLFEALWNTIDDNYPFDLDDWDEVYYKYAPKFKNLSTGLNQKGEGFLENKENAINWFKEILNPNRIIDGHFSFTFNFHNDSFTYKPLKKNNTSDSQSPYNYVNSNFLDFNELKRIHSVGSEYKSMKMLLGTFHNTKIAYFHLDSFYLKQAFESETEKKQKIITKNSLDEISNLFNEIGKTNKNIENKFEKKLINKINTSEINDLIFEYLSKRENNENQERKKIIEDFFKMADQKDNLGAILDLRNNRGGRVEDINFFISRFLTKDTIYAKSRIKKGPGFREYFPWIPEKIFMHDQKLNFKKIVILINEKSISLAETSAAILSQEKPRIWIIGKNTSGAFAPIFGEIDETKEVRGKSIIDAFNMGGNYKLGSGNLSISLQMGVAAIRIYNHKTGKYEIFEKKGLIPHQIVEGDRNQLEEAINYIKD